MDKLTHNTNLRVRYVETDQMGVVNNGNYLTYFEVGRTELMRSYHLPYMRLEETGYYFPLLESYAQYLKPAHYDNILVIKTKLPTVPSARIRFDYEICCEEEILTRGYTVHCFMDIATMHAVRPPKYFIDFLNKFAAMNN